MYLADGDTGDGADRFLHGFLGDGNGMHLHLCGKIHRLFTCPLMVADVLAQHCQQQDIYARARRENDAGELHDETETGGEFARGGGFARNRRCGVLRSCRGGFFRSRLGDRMRINKDARVRGLFCGGGGWRECGGKIIRISAGGIKLRSESILIFFVIVLVVFFVIVLVVFLVVFFVIVLVVFLVIFFVFVPLLLRGLISGIGCFVCPIFIGRRCLCSIRFHGNIRWRCNIIRGRRSRLCGCGCFFARDRLLSGDGVKSVRRRGSIGHIFSRVVYEAQIARADGREDQHHRHYGQQRLPALYHCCFISFHSNQTDLRKAAQITASSYQPSERRRLRFSLR